MTDVLSKSPSDQVARAHPTDVHVGQRLRQRRRVMGMTQQSLAESVGIRFQQIQKYESGANRVSASRLWALSEALKVPVGHFFEGLPRDAACGCGHRKVHIKNLEE